MHVAWYLRNEAYGAPEPAEGMQTLHAQTATLKFHKKVISYFNPDNTTSWIICDQSGKSYSVEGSEQVEEDSGDTSSQERGKGQSKW